MDELPDLRSDADVDALMARIQARIAPAATQPAASGSSRSASAAADSPFAAFVAAQEGFTSAMLRALQLVAESLEELELARPNASRPRTARRVTTPRKAKRRTTP